MLLFYIACFSQTEVTDLPPQRTPQINDQARPDRPVMPAKIPGLRPAEDLSSSWKESFAVTIQSTDENTNCLDTDADGYFDAKSCGDYRNIEEIDCDDSDPKIGPQQERYIRRGPFIMGSDSEHAGSDEAPVHIVHLDGFCLDRNEVSLGDFSDWLIQNNRTASGPDIRHIDTDNQVDPERRNYPVEGVTWEEARDFCADKGKSLPTEAQWEKAARGGCEFGRDNNKCDPDDLRSYPWGNEAPNCQRANHQLSAEGIPKLCHSDTLLPNALPEGKGPYGHHHLAGNVWEYVQDIWHPKVYKNHRTNPGGPKKGTIHVLRGGSWNTFSTNMRVANRFHDLVMGSAAGFRCARPLVKSQHDNVPELLMETVSGRIVATTELQGRALYVTAFDANDADEKGMLAPGRSPIAETRFIPNQKKEQTFTIDLPKDGTYILSAALDSGTEGKKEKYISASGSGGFGQAVENPIAVRGPVQNITIRLQPPPKHPVINHQQKPHGNPPVHQRGR